MRYAISSCPFCGSDAEIDANTNYMCHIGCTNNKCRAGLVTIGRNRVEEAVKRWNRRNSRGLPQIVEVQMQLFEEE